MDKLDTRLLTALMKDSRVPTTQLAKELGISREVASYRMGRLKKEGIIIDYVSEINTEKLGWIGAAVFVNVKATRQTEFKDFLNSCEFVSWVAELSGVWSFGMSIFGKSNAELDERFLTIYEGFENDIIDHRFTLHRRSLFFYEKYFGVLPEQKPLRRPVEYKVDEKDKLILKELAKNARIGSVELATKVHLTAPAVSHRIRQLHLGGYIAKHSVFVDISKLGLLQYSVFILNKNIGQKDKLVSYLASHPNVSFIAEYVADPFLEFGLITKDPYDSRRILQEIEEAFPDNRVMEISLFQKELFSVIPPACVFE